MKVSIAVIKLVLRTNKVLSDGSRPIMLRVSFNGMKERSIGIKKRVVFQMNLKYNPSLDLPFLWMDFLTVP